MTVAILRGDARQIPLPGGCVDLVVTSPPYFGLRSYVDAGEHYDGQIGSEATPAEWLAAMIACTAEMVRVLKPEGSIFINLGDKFSIGNSGDSGMAKLGERWAGGGHSDGKAKIRSASVPGLPPKTLLGLPWRYALRCMDELGLILRRDIIWAKPNGLPESVTDRCRSAHEYVFHLVKQPRYYSAIDEIREPHIYPGDERWKRQTGSRYDPAMSGKLPGSVWSIPSQPLTVPPDVGVDHFAAFPVELPRRIVLGWSPPGVCVACGQGRRPVADRANRPLQRIYNGTLTRVPGAGREDCRRGVPQVTEATITGYACACTPYTDHPGTGETSGPGYGDSLAAGDGYSHPLPVELRETKHQRARGAALDNRPKVGPWREYHLDGWQPPPTRPALVLDPFAGTGTTLLAAAAYGRNAIGIDRSADYCRLAKWRVHDPSERAKAMQVPKPPPIPDGMEALF